MFRLHDYIYDVDLLCMDKRQHEESFIIRSMDGWADCGCEKMLSHVMTSLRIGTRDLDTLVWGALCRESTW